MQLLADGAISFAPTDVDLTTDPFPLDNQRALLAVFWADINLQRGGNLHYHFTTTEEDLDRATTLVRSAFPSSPSTAAFRATHLFVATWEGVVYDGSGDVLVWEIIRNIIVVVIYNKR